MENPDYARKKTLESLRRTQLASLEFARHGNQVQTHMRELNEMLERLEARVSARQLSNR